MRAILLAFTLLVASVYGQLAGTTTAEQQPSITVSQCTSTTSCTDVSTSITIDANWRWLHRASGDCYKGNQWLCGSSPSACADCVLEGSSSSDYTGTYGITTSNKQVSLKFVTQGPYSKNIGSRIYLMENQSQYKIFKLLNKEFAFDVDVSQLVCGLNGALYFVEMAADGGMSAYPNNKAGAKYGTGYCDAQCPHDVKYINGEANNINWVPSSNDANSGKGSYGTCCPELDIWEANSISTAFTPHPCTVSGQTRCSGNDCGDGANRYTGVCDKDGCDFNAFRMGNQSFYGPGKIIDTNKPVTVVTQFITTDGTDNGDLKEIRRIYVQNGVVIGNPVSTYTTLSSSNSLTDSSCTAAKTLFGDTNDFATKGGMKQMGASMKRGLVLVMSLWDDHDSNCLWLDGAAFPVDKSPSTPGIARGTCATTSGVPADVEKNSPDATVKFSNIRWGPFGGTTAGVPSPSGQTGASASSTTGSQTATGASSASTSAGSNTNSNGASATNTGASATNSAASGSSTTSTSCPIGSVGCKCTAGGSCDKGLSCLSTFCVDAGHVKGNSATLVTLSAAAASFAAAAFFL